MDPREVPAMHAEAEARGFQHDTRLTFFQHSKDREAIHRWIQITRGDMDCGDVANYKAIGEIKTLADAMYWKHLIWQVIKMSWTDKFVAVFIRDYYNSRFDLIHKARMKEGSISANEHRFQTKCARMNVPVFYCNTINDLFNRVEWFLEHCDEGPKPINTYNIHMNKFETPVVILCGIAGIGENIARLFLDHAGGSLSILTDDINNMTRGYFVSNYSEVKGLNEKYPELLWDSFHEVLQPPDMTFNRVFKMQKVKV